MCVHVYMDGKVFSNVEILVKSCKYKSETFNLMGLEFVLAILHFM